MENCDSHFNQNTYTFSLVLTTCLCPNHMVSSFQVDLLVISTFFSVKENRIKNEKKKNITREKILSCQMVTIYSNGLLSKVVESIMY